MVKFRIVVILRSGCVELMRLVARSRELNIRAIREEEKIPLCTSWSSRSGYTRICKNCELVGNLSCARAGEAIGCGADTDVVV